MIPVLSVIVPVYNTKQYLSRCIESILGQSFQDFELLLIDDGSTDGSGDVCDTYSARDCRVRVFHKRNGGASSARNVGLENVRGQWLTFVDSDDWIEQDYFLVPYDSDVDLFYRNRVLSSGQHEDLFGEQKAKDRVFYDFLVSNARSIIFQMSVCFFYRRAFINEHGIRFIEGVRLGEDRLFILDCYRFCRSIQVLTYSHYVYNRSDQWRSKYILPWQEINQWLGLFMDRYDALPVKSPEIAATGGFIFNHIDPKEKGIRIHQALSTNVLRYKSVFLASKSFGKKVKFYFLKFLSFIVHV